MTRTFEYPAMSVGETKSSRAERRGRTVRAVFSKFVHDPYHMLILRWNWKSAVVSSLLRAGIFFSVNLAAGWRAAVGAMLAELALRSITSGFYGAITEAFSLAEPPWKATAVTMLMLPVLNHSLEIFVHWMRGTPKLLPSILASMVFTSVSTAFNLHAMRHGILTVGDESKSLAHDLSRVPVLLYEFFALSFVSAIQWVSAFLIRLIPPR